MKVEDRTSHEAARSKRGSKGLVAPCPPCPKRRKTTARGRRSRPWVFSTRDFSRNNRFVIVSYNILGVENASKHPDLYKLVDPKNLAWDRRKRRIRKELRQYDPDILCFQEVDRFEDLANLFCKDGYVGVYQARTGDANDGCAIFWRKKQFALLHEENIQFLEFGLRNNVAQICVFKVLDPRPDDLSRRRDRTLLVGNIHVLFNPNRGDVKLGQMRLFLDKSHEISEQWGIAPVVIAGDFNSLPRSALYQFISDSKLEYLNHDRRAISGQIRRRSFTFFRENRSRWKCAWSEEEKLLAAGSKDLDILVHRLHLRSAYPGVPGRSGRRDGNGEPLVTSFHSEFLGTVDYIWHSAGLAPVGVVEMPPISTVKELGCLPSEVPSFPHILPHFWGMIFVLEPLQRCGSDHLALVCEFAFVGDDNVGSSNFSD